MPPAKSDTEMGPVLAFKGPRNVGLSTHLHSPHSVIAIFLPGERAFETLWLPFILLSVALNQTSSFLSLNPTVLMQTWSTWP